MYIKKPKIYEYIKNMQFKFLFKILILKKKYVSNLVSPIDFPHKYTNS